MTPDLILQVIQLGTMVIYALGVFVALKSHKQQIHTQIFIEFSARFHGILGRLPFQAWAGAESDGEQLTPPGDEITRATLQCFHIMADLYHLHQGGYISQDLWQQWQQGIRRILQGPFMRREWTALDTAFSHYPDFCSYVRELMEERGSVHVFHVPYVSSHDDALSQSGF